MNQDIRMKQLVQEIDEVYKGCWVGFKLYGEDFCALHLRSDGEVFLRVQAIRTKEVVGVDTVAELAQFVRKAVACAGASDDHIFEDLSRAVWVAIFSSDSKTNGKTILIEKEHFLTRYICGDILIRLQFVINAEGGRVWTIAECIREVFPTLLSPEEGEYIYSTIRVIDAGFDFNNPSMVREWVELKIAEINRLIAC